MRQLSPNVVLHYGVKLVRILHIDHMRAMWQQRMLLKNWPVINGMFSQRIYYVAIYILPDVTILRFLLTFEQLNIPGLARVQLILAIRSEISMPFKEVDAVGRPVNNLDPFAQPHFLPYLFIR